MCSKRTTSQVPHGSREREKRGFFCVGETTDIKIFESPPRIFTPQFYRTITVRSASLGKMKMLNFQ